MGDVDPRVKESVAATEDNKPRLEKLRQKILHILNFRLNS